MAERGREGRRSARRPSGGTGVRRRGKAGDSARDGSGRSAAAPRVAVLMGSRSDWEAMRAASETLDELGIAHEVHVASAHRTPDRVRRLARGAEERGLEVLIAGAGGAAHLAGALAAQTLLPVLGVPLASSSLGGFDALLSTVQMPAGVPVGTLGIGPAGARNAALLAASILARKDPALRERLAAWRRERAAAAAKELPR